MLWFRIFHFFQVYFIILGNIDQNPKNYVFWTRFTMVTVFFGLKKILQKYKRLRPLKPCFLIKFMYLAYNSYKYHFIDSIQNVSYFKINLFQKVNTPNYFKHHIWIPRYRFDLNQIIYNDILARNFFLEQRPILHQ